MALDTDVFDTDLESLIADMPQTMTFNGADYLVLAGETVVAKAPEIAGIMPEQGRRVVCRRSVFTNGEPGVNDVVVLGSVRYRVHSVSDTPEGKQRNLECVAEVA